MEAILSDRFKKLQPGETTSAIVSPDTRRLTTVAVAERFDSVVVYDVMCDDDGWYVI